MQYLPPALLVIFALAFGLMARRLPALRYLRYFAFAFLLSGLGLLVQGSEIPADRDINPLLATILYFSGALLFAEGSLRRSGRTMTAAFHVIAFGVLLLGYCYFLFVARDIAARAVIQNFGFGFILLTAAWQLRRHALASTADRILFWTLVIVGAHFFPRTLMTIGSLTGEGVEFSADSVFWVTTQYVVALLATGAALSLSAVMVTDIAAELTLERDTDMLTGVLNRRGLEHRVADRAGGNSGDSYAVVVADLDHFKSINDTYGHAAGDAVLEEAATRLKRSVRETDLVARLGGEEFVFVIAGTVHDGAALAERLRRVIEEEAIDFDGSRLNVTASFGVAPFHSGETFWDVVRRADAALYSAKQAGRNHVRVSDGDPAGTPG